MWVDLFDYDLPPELIAAVPSARRDESRLLVLNRADGAIEHRRFFELPQLLGPGDVLVMNQARVMPARLRTRRAATGGTVEVLLVRPLEQDGPERWLAMMAGRGRLRQGEELQVGGGAQIKLLERQADGSWVVELQGCSAESAMEAGLMPLPPYVLRSRRRLGMPQDMPELDRERYQTVYAREAGAVAAPTAGLHFTQPLLDQVRERGVQVCMLTLLVGPGTFRPVRAKRVESHRMEAEFYRLPGETASAVEAALREGRRVIAVGTTTCRALEHVARSGQWKEQEGWTDLFIYPPYEFRAVSALITNFHLPRSTLLMLVSALAGREAVLKAYQAAIKEGYRFYSYGDAMFIR